MAELLERLGQSVFKNKGLIAGAAGAAAASGFMSGLGSNPNGSLSSQLYGLTTGNPNIDQDVFGTNYSVADTMMPMFPRAPTVGSMTVGGGIGGVAGGVSGFMLGSKLAKHLGRGKLISSIFGAGVGMLGAGVGTGVGAVAGVAGSLSPRERRLVFNPTMVSRYMTDQRTIANRNRYNTTGVDVSGDMVFGQYNFRGGST